VVSAQGLIVETPGDAVAEPAWALAPGRGVATGAVREAGSGDWFVSGAAVASLLWVTSGIGIGGDV